MADELLQNPDAGTEPPVIPAAVAEPAAIPSLKVSSSTSTPQGLFSSLSLTKNLARLAAVLTLGATTVAAIRWAASDEMAAPAAGVIPQETPLNPAEAIIIEKGIFAHKDNYLRNSGVQADNKESLLLSYTMSALNFFAPNFDLTGDQPERREKLKKLFKENEKLMRNQGINLSDADRDTLASALSRRIIQVGKGDDRIIFFEPAPVNKHLTAAADIAAGYNPDNAKPFIWENLRHNLHAAKAVSAESIAAFDILEKAGFEKALINNVNSPLAKIGMSESQRRAVAEIPVDMRTLKSDYKRTATRIDKALTVSGHLLGQAQARELELSATR